MKYFFAIILVVAFLSSCSKSVGEKQNTSNSDTTVNQQITEIQQTVSFPALYTEEDSAYYENLYKTLSQSIDKDQELGEIIVKVGKNWLNIPYTANTLETTGGEKLVVRFSSFDCVTFLENTLAVSRLLKNEKNTFYNFLEELKNIRYRNGEIIDYTSRLHYFSDWLFNKTEMNIVNDITKQIGGIAAKKTINFMTTHKESYNPLVNSTIFNEIENMEKDISQREYFYLPKNKVEENETDIKNGDLILITTSVEGLDIAHVGFAYFQNGRLHFLHASSSEQKVVISEKPLADYLASVSKHTGILVARAL